MNDRGVALAQAGEPERALRCWELAAALDPGLAQASFNRAAGLARKGAFEQALKVLEGGLVMQQDARALRLRETLLKGLEENRPQGGDEDEGHPDRKGKAQGEIDHGAQKDP